MDLLLPPVCPACDAAAVGLCERCRVGLSALPFDGCVRCGAPLAPDGRCLASHRGVRRLRQVVAPLRFVGVGGELVRRFKLGGDAAAGRLLAREMVFAWRSRGLAPRPVIVPVPLHRQRRRQRGFDQARWLGERVARRLCLRVAAGSLVRVRATRPQGDATVISRTENVRGVFALRRSSAIRGRDVLLVDDVFTTGATARACEAVLRAAGARSTSLLAACRSRA